jgi:hypothetical protein
MAKSKARQRATLFAILLVVGTMATVLGCAPRAAQPEAQPEANEASGSEQGAPIDSPIAITWGLDSDCAICHTSQQASMTDTATSASLHTDESCLNCHTDTEKLEKLHGDVTTASLTPSLLKRTKVASATCLSCHVQEELTTDTAASTTLTDQLGTTVNPHGLPANDKHETLNCGSCHKMHDSGAELEKNTVSTCRGCHHADVYECYTCHT